MPRNAKAPTCGFNPKQTPLKNKDDYAINAVREQREIWRVTEKLIHKEMTDFHTCYNLGQTDKISMQARGVLLENTNHYSVIDITTGTYIFKHPSAKQNYTFGCDGARFLELEKVGDCYKLADPQYIHFNKRILVGDKTQLLNDYNLYSVTQHINIENFTLPKTFLTQGVPGCGKNTYILDKVTDKDLVLFTTREGAEEFRCRYKEIHPEKKNNKALNNRMRTTHCFILNSYKLNNHKFNRVKIDEALMMHCGRSGRPPRKKNKKNNQMDQLPPATGPVPNLTMNTSSGQIVNRGQPPATRKASTPSVIPNQNPVETNKKPTVVASHSLPPQPPRPTPLATAAPIISKRLSASQPAPAISTHPSETQGAILDVKSEPEPVEVPTVAPPPPPLPAVEVIKQEIVEPTLPTTLPSVFDPLPESSIDEKPLLTLQALSHPTDVFPSGNQECYGAGILNNSIPNLVPVPTPVLVSTMVPVVVTDMNKNSTINNNSSNNFSASFKPKQEQNLKNASSWSSLAQSPTTNSPLPPPPIAAAMGTKAVADQFLAYKKQAKEKIEKQKALIEQQELRRQQKEQAEKERMRLENERRREKEEEDALEKARKAVAEQTKVEEVKVVVPEETGSPSQVDKSAAERERQRLREQERRRREAMASQIDMNMQSDLMAAFEESL